MPSSIKEQADKCKSVFDAFGFNCYIEVAPKPKGLPLYMVHSRSFFNVTFYGINFIVVIVNESEKFTADALARQVEKYELATSRPVALFFEKTSALQKKAMFKNGIPFLSTPSALFLPFLGIAMQKRKAHAPETVLDVQKKLAPQSQVLFLHMLYKVKDAYVSKADAARATGLSAMAISRGSKELEARGLVKLKEHGRTIQMTCTTTGHNLFAKAEPYLTNPVEKNIVIMSDNLKSDYLKAGESALSEMSMLSAPKAQTFACTKSDISPTTIDYTKDSRWIPSEKMANVQIWKYSPNLFAINGHVDPISLYMSLKDSTDERIQASLEEMMESVKW